MWSVEHDKISPEIQKIVMASNFGDIFGSHISGTGGQKRNFFGKWFYSDKSNLSKTEENLSWSLYKSFNFTGFLQTVALNIYVLFYSFLLVILNTEKQ